MPKWKDSSLKIFFFVLLFASAAIRLFLSVFPKTASTYNDELFNLELAQNLLLRGSLCVYTAPVRFSRLLYPLLVSPFYAVADGMLRTRLISGFNALLVSSSLIPGYLLAKRLLKNNLHVALALVLLAVSPNLLFSLTFMAENLYFPLLLWAFWAAYRFLEDISFSSAVLLGLLSFLLFFTMETGAAFLAALLLLFLFTRSFRPLAGFLAGFGVPCLLVRFTLLAGIGYSARASWTNLRSASQLMFFCYAAGLLLLFFLVSTLFFPVVLPLVERKKLPQPGRRLLFLSGLFVLFLAVGVSLGVMVVEEYAAVRPRIPLCYFLGAAFPFLLLFFCLLESSGSDAPDSPETLKSFIKRPLVRVVGVLAVLVLLFFFIPIRRSLVDYPLLHFADYLWPESLKWVWFLRLALLGFLALGLFLLWKKWTKLFACLVLVPLLFMELAGGAAFNRTARWNERLPGTERMEEISLLEKTLDTLEGNVLVITPSAQLPLLKLMNTLLRSDYAVTTTEDLQNILLDHAEEGLTAFSMADLEIPVPFRRFSLNEFYSLSSVDYLLTVGGWNLIDVQQYEEITPPGLSSFHLYQALDPSRLSLLDPLLDFSDDPPSSGETGRKDRFRLTGSVR